MKKPTTAILLLAISLLAGCTTSPSTKNQTMTYEEMGFDGATWPDLHGAEVVVLDHGAFDYVFGEAKKRFETLTNGTLKHIAAQDTGDALNRAIREQDAPSFDVVYGLDNAYLPKAIAANSLQPFKPQLANQIEPQYIFFDPDGVWHATPVDHGFIAVNVDPRANLTVNNLFDVRQQAKSFVTQDPRTSSPGLGFLLATIATFGDGDAYDWQDYWRELFAGGVSITSDWTTAYVGEFTGGYGQHETGFTGKKALVTSYTTSPAYEVYYGATDTNTLVLADRGTFHQIETVALAAKPRHLAAAQAFIEFTLTLQFQELHAEYNAVYPVIANISVDNIYGGRDPAPGSFVSDGLTSETIGRNVERWVREWVDLYEAHQAA